MASMPPLILSRSGAMHSNSAISQGHMCRLSSNITVAISKDATVEIGEIKHFSF